MVHYFLSWYSGAIWGNILASLVWVVPGFFYHRFHVKKIHIKLDAIHNLQDSHGEK